MQTLINYYTYSTLLIWSMFLISIVMNVYVYQRQMLFGNKPGKIETIRNIIKIFIRSILPIIRITILYSAYVLLTYSDEEIEQIRNRKEE